MKTKSIKPYLMILPIIVLSFVFVYRPFLKSAICSFFTVSAKGKVGSFVGLGNYLKLLKDGLFTESLLVNLKFILIFVPLNTFVVTLAAVLTEKAGKRKGIVETMYVLPLALGLSSASILFKVMFSGRTGIINRLLGMNLPWDDNAVLALISVAFLGVYLDFSLDYLLLLSAFRNIDKGPVEAARIDGANEAEVFFRITLPLVGHTFFFIVFIALKDALLISAPIMVMTEGGPFRSTTTLTLYYYNEAFRGSRYQSAYAISTLTFLISLAITALSMIAERKTRVES